MPLICLTLPASHLLLFCYVTTPFTINTTEDVYNQVCNIFVSLNIPFQSEIQGCKMGFMLLTFKHFNCKL